MLAGDSAVLPKLIRAVNERKPAQIAFLCTNGVHWVLFVHDLGTRAVIAYDSYVSHCRWDIWSQRTIVALVSDDPPSQCPVSSSEID